MFFFPRKIVSVNPIFANPLLQSVVEFYSFQNPIDSDFYNNSVVEFLSFRIIIQNHYFVAVNLLYQNLVNLE